MPETRDSAPELAVELPRSTDASVIARTAVHARLERELPSRQLDDLLVIVSELTTNAAIYGVGEIRLRLAVEGTRVYGEVADEGAGFVSDVRERRRDEIGKRGLLIVAKLADCWGIHEGSSRVWFEIDARPV